MSQTYDRYCCLPCGQKAGGIHQSRKVDRGDLNCYVISHHNYGKISTYQHSKKKKKKKSFLLKFWTKEFKMLQQVESNRDILCWIYRRIFSNFNYADLKYYFGFLVIQNSGIFQSYCLLSILFFLENIPFIPQIFISMMTTIIPQLTRQQYGENQSILENADHVTS